MPFTIDAPKGPDIPDGSYKAQLTAVESGQGKFGPQRKWIWLVDVNGKGEEFSDFTSANTSPSSKAYERLTALTGKAPQVGETLEDPVGKTALIQVVRNAKGYPKIDAVLPLVEPQQVEAGIPR